MMMLSPEIDDALGVTENYHNVLALTYVRAGVATKDG